MTGSKILSSVSKLVPLLDPIADAFSGTVVTSPINMRDAHAIHFIITKGVGATGTSTVTVEACDDTVPTTTSAVAFKYVVRTTSDTYGALTNATTSGFVTTAGSSQRYIIEVDADQLANSGYKYVRLKMVESVDSPVLGGIDAILYPLRGENRAANAQTTVLS